MRLEEIFGKVWVHKDMTSSPRCQTWGGCGVRGCVYLKASAPIRAILQLLCAFPLCELPLRQSWDRLQRCDRAEMPNDTGRLSGLSDPVSPLPFQGLRGVYKEELLPTYKWGDQCSDTGSKMPRVTQRTEAANRAS